jgi:predicted nucleic acid-binding protein
MPSRFVRVGPGELDRMDELTSIGFKSMDALHAACAESGGCDVLLTTDDKFLNRARRLQARLRVRVENPLVWMQEQLEHERSTDDSE